MKHYEIHLAKGVENYQENVFAGPSNQQECPDIGKTERSDASGICGLESEMFILCRRGCNAQSAQPRARSPYPFSVISPSYLTHTKVSKGSHFTSSIPLVSKHESTSARDRI